MIIRKYITIRYLILFILFASFTFGLEARNLVTKISNDKTPIHNNSIIICIPITKQGIPFIDVISDAMNIPKTVKITDEKAFEYNALSLEAFQLTLDQSNRYFGEVVLPYLIKSQELTDALKLRRTARQIKYHVFDAYFDKDPKKLENKIPFPKHLKVFPWTPYAIQPHYCGAFRRFLSQQIVNPIVILSKPPLPKTMPTPGPAMIPIGVEVVKPNNTSERLYLETSSICITDLKAGNEVIFSVKDSILNDTLDIVLCHELAHSIMFDMYGKRFTLIQRVSTNGHDAPIITDKGLAYIEGWAEAFEAIYGGANPHFKEKDRKKYNISEFLFTRQDPIRRERYIWEKPFGKKTGILKNGSQMMATEGVIASLFYDILTSRAINAAFEKCVTTMLLYTPLNFEEFINKYLTLYPEDRQTILRIILENTKYGIMDNTARKLYYNYYQNKLLYVQKKISNEEFRKAEKAYLDYKENLFKNAMNGANIFGNVGPELWLKGKLVFEKAGLFKKKQEWEFRIDLNTVTYKILRVIGFDSASAEKIIAARNEKGYFTGHAMKILQQLVDPSVLQNVIKNTGLTYLYIDDKLADKYNVNNNSEKYLWPEDLEKAPILAEDI